MTLEDLLAQFKAGFRERLHAPLPRPEGDEAIRAGIRAVVRRVLEWQREPTTAAHAAFLHEILASDGVEAAAELPKPQTRTVPLTGITKTVRPDVVFEPDAPAAAPDVCVWTRATSGPLKDSFPLETGCGYAFRERSLKDGWCPSCGRPISFKSEAAR